ncbi:MAG: GNAT family N-acetyltransferase [Eubacteriales bacterium]|nr:GNAT family N-acetyltransferase [Eubacteriales bacterium]
MVIRWITPADDRLEISRIYEQSWKYAYAGVIPQAYLDSIPEGRWAEHLDDANRHTLLCFDDGKMIGTSSFSASRFAQFAGWGEIISVYLLPDAMRKGYGTALLKAAIDELKKRGYRDVFLWVLEENLRARSFYEKLGFSPTGDYLDDTIGGKDLREIRYILKT